MTLAARYTHAIMTPLVHSIRLPDDLYRRLAAEAKRNERSVQAEARVTFDRVLPALRSKRPQPQRRRDERCT